MTYTTPHTISFWLPVPALTQLGALAALNVVQVVTVLRQEFIVAGIKGQTVSARLQLRCVVVALPVFVAAAIVWVETEVVGAFE